MEGVQERVPQLPLEEAQLIIMEVLYKGSPVKDGVVRHIREIARYLKGVKHPAIVAVNPLTSERKTWIFEVKKSKQSIVYRVQSGRVTLYYYKVTPATQEYPLSKLEQVRREVHLVELSDIRAECTPEFKQMAKSMLDWLTQSTTYTEGVVPRIPVHSRLRGDSIVVGGKISHYHQDGEKSRLLLDSGYFITIEGELEAPVGHYAVQVRGNVTVMTEAAFQETYVLV